MIAKKFSVLSPNEFRNLVNTYGTAAQKALMGTANTDWQEEIYQTAITSDNNLSVSGSVKKLPYRLSLGYLNQDGILKTGNLQRISTGMTLNPVLLDNHLKIIDKVQTDLPTGHHLHKHMERKKFYYTSFKQHVANLKAGVYG